VAEPAALADVAVVGGGPAGLAAATALRGRGVARVAVLEREPVAGGTPRHCGHPPFGMRELGRVLTGPAYARRLVERALAAGVEILTGHGVTALAPGGRLEVATPAGRRSFLARRVVLATGVRETPRSARLIGGDRPMGVLTTGALQAMVHLEGLAPFRRPVILGTELVSLSAVLTCRRAGIRPVALIEAGERPITRRPFALLPQLLGIPVHYGAELLAIRGRERVEAVTLRLADGVVVAIACDGVLCTGCFVPEAALVRGSHLELDPGSQGPAIDQYGRCSDPACFAAGNLLRPVETAGWSHQEGQRVGGLVADDLAGLLPPPLPAVPVLRGEGIRLVVPQRLAPAGAVGLRHLQLRVARAMRGELAVTSDDGVTLWRRRLMALPERRLLVRMADLRIPRRARSLSISFRP
jgi:NADPH-dependent 2,4-dienoyl-CoA reductase/sulfur reductase-like enzyme